MTTIKFLNKDDFFEALTLLTVKNINVEYASLRKLQISIGHIIPLDEVPDSYWKKLDRYVQKEVGQIISNWKYRRLT
jgi:hypothetical protein